MKEKIKVKGMDQPVDFDIKFTHRGPIFNYALLRMAGPLIGGTVPSPSQDFWYSHSWGGQYVGNQLSKIIENFANGVSVKQTMTNLNTQKGPYLGFPVNLVMVDTDDIGYMMLVPYPKRKD